jgi:adenylate cyclase class 2
MLEVEMKFPAGNISEIERKLGALHSPLLSTRDEVDQYFNAPDRDFAQTDEALRLRRIGEKNFLTYKGPKRDSETKTRLELEVAFAEGNEPAGRFTLILQVLGYRPVAEVRKRRRIYHLKRENFDVEVCLDQVHEVGTFVELEISTQKSDEAEARRTIKQLAGELGLEGSERRSYLEILLSRRGLRS